MLLESWLSRCPIYGWRRLLSPKLQSGQLKRSQLLRDAIAKSCIWSNSQSNRSSVDNAAETDQKMRLRILPRSPICRKSYFTSHNWSLTVPVILSWLIFFFSLSFYSFLLFSFIPSLSSFLLPFLFPSSFISFILCNFLPLCEKCFVEEPELSKSFGGSTLPDYVVKKSPEWKILTR